MRSGLTVALNAIRVPSGDQSKEPTLKSLPLVRCTPAAGDAWASSTVTVQRCTKLYSRRTTL